MVVRVPKQRCLWLLSLAWVVIISPTSAFVTLEVPCRPWKRTSTNSFFAGSAGEGNDDGHDVDDCYADGPSVSSSTTTASTTTTLSYQDSDGASKGLVGSLTALVNSLSPSPSSNRSTLPSTIEINMDGSSSSSVNAPSSSQELVERLRNDYTERNYLWTGDLDLDCFTDDCRFTDPTLTFIGTEKFRENTQNLIPVVTALVSLERARSVLLSIEDRPQEGYVETRWNMVGTLDRNPLLFWQPKIDVIGRTRFWYKEQNDEDDDEDKDVRVYFYDEEWEIPAYQALLQLITPAGTITNAQK